MYNWTIERLLVNNELSVYGLYNLFTNNQYFTKASQVLRHKRSLHQVFFDIYLLLSNLKSVTLVYL